MKMRHWSPAHVRFPSPITHIDILHHQAVSKGKFSTSTVIHVDYILDSRSDIAVLRCDSNKMNWFEPREPSNLFRETVEVFRNERNGSCYLAVTIHYDNRGRGGTWKLFLSSFFRHFDSTMFQRCKVNIFNCFYSFIRVQYHRWRLDSKWAEERKRSKTYSSD